jgi:hypothetical protein
MERWKKEKMEQKKEGKRWREFTRKEGEGEEKKKWKDQGRWKKNGRGKGKEEKGAGSGEERGSSRKDL